MKVGLGADHAGFELKNKIAAWLREKEIEVVDFGNTVYNAKDDYPDFIIPAARAAATKEVDKGIVICGSGVGACITANKIKGARASICHDTYSAHQGVEHDDMNILCLGARIIGETLAKEILFSFVNAKFINEERFTRRLDKITILENI